MAQVPDKVLLWLYSVLHEYSDPQRTYSDTARALSVHPTVAPRTEVYTYESGASSLLLTLSGTLPVPFRGITYRFPVKLWIPNSYPQDAPMVYIVAGKEMAVRPGQHVGVDGRVYHPYLSDWGGMWDRASIAEFLEYLVQVFAKEPPVISRAQQQQYRRSLTPNTQYGPGAGPAPPPPPPKQRVGSPNAADVPSTSRPPPRPPKPGEEHAEPSRDASRNGPPLPPLPPFASSSRQPSNHQYLRPRTPSQSLATPIHGYHNGRPLGPSALLAMPHHQQTPQRTIHDRSPVSPVSPVNGYSAAVETKYARPALLPPPQIQQRLQQQQQPPAPYLSQQPPQPQTFSYSQPQPYQQTQAPLQIPLQRQQFMNSQPDLLSDPFDLALPGSSQSRQPAAAPPIPPNPEKEHLLHALSTTLVQQAQQKVNQTLSAIAPLQAQQQALRAAHDQLDAEIRQLEALDQALSSNEAILHHSIRECDQTIATAKSKKQPPIDEVLIAPTMVANQLWTLCAEEAACREAMYVLQKAVDRGRVSGNDFVRQMRGLGRECFLKMALARKCATGMGLELPQ